MIVPSLVPFPLWKEGNTVPVTVISTSRADRDTSNQSNRMLVPVEQELLPVPIVK